VSVTTDALLDLSSASTAPTAPTASAPTPPEPPGWQPAGQGGLSGWSAGGSYPTGPATPPTQPYGAGGSGSGLPPDSGGSDQGPFGSGGRLALIIVGMVVLIGGVVAATYFFAIRPAGGKPTPTPSSSTGASPSASNKPSPSPSTPSQSATATPGGGLPTAAAVPANIAVVPMRPDAQSDRGLYLIDTEDKAKPVQLDAAPGDNSNPMMPPSRNTIIYLNAGVLRVMASDGSGDRKLFGQYPAGCDQVTHASWSQVNPNLMVISCRQRGEKDAMLVIGVDGKLVRRLDSGKDFVGDLSLSPDGQTVAFWATNQQNASGASLFTLPVIGTGDPKRLANGANGLNSHPAWSPDGSQIAVSRQVGQGNNDIFVINLDGSDRVVTDSKAFDTRPCWSPDGKNLLISTNRKSADGAPGKTFGLALIRISDREVIGFIDLQATQINRPFWTTR
jgi:WD40-like Beta Propeller Repeat